VTEDWKQQLAGLAPVAAAMVMNLAAMVQEATRPKIMLFVVHDEPDPHDYGAVRDDIFVVWDCPTDRLKELAREACIEYENNTHILSVIALVKARFELAGYRCEALASRIPEELWFDVQELSK
jgi:hypothetical protein